MTIYVDEVTTIELGSVFGRDMQRHQKSRRLGVQIEIQFRARGGKRRGAGRKPKNGKAGVSHHGRKRINGRYPLHVTMRVAKGVRNLRGREGHMVVRAALEHGGAREGFRVVEYSIQGNHIHLLVESANTSALSKGMQGLTISLARRINCSMGRRRGTVFPDRYHVNELKTPTQTRRCLAYVLLNGRKHAAQAGRNLPRDWVDSCSSAPYFEGFSKPVDAAKYAEFHRLRLPRAQTWMLREGYKKVGLVDPFSCPKTS